MPIKPAAPKPPPPKCVDSDGTRCTGCISCKGLRGLRYACVKCGTYIARDDYGECALCFVLRTCALPWWKVAH